MAKFSFNMNRDQVERLIAFVSSKADNIGDSPEDYLGAIRVVGVETAINGRKALGASFYAQLSADEESPAAPLFRWDGQMTMGRYLEVSKPISKNFLVVGDFGEREEGGEIVDLTSSRFLKDAVEYANTGVRYIPVALGKGSRELPGEWVSWVVDWENIPASAMPGVRRVRTTRPVPDDGFVDVREDNPA